MDVKELPGWILGETILHVVCEGSSVHAVVPFGDNDPETSQTLQRLSTEAWLRPYMDHAGSKLIRIVHKPAMNS